MIYKRTKIVYRKMKTGDSHYFSEIKTLVHKEAVQVTTIYFLGIPVFISEKLLFPS